MTSWQPDRGLENPGLNANGSWQRKNNSPYGEAAMLNQLPPGQVIEDQHFALINDMKYKEFDGDQGDYAGGSPWPRYDVGMDE
jgi:hypothetical protein